MYDKFDNFSTRKCQQFKTHSKNVPEIRLAPPLNYDVLHFTSSARRQHNIKVLIVSFKCDLFAFVPVVLIRTLLLTRSRNHASC